MVTSERSLSGKAERSPGVDGDQVWTMILEGPRLCGAGRWAGGQVEREVRSEIQGRGEAGPGLELSDLPWRASLGFTRLPHPLRRLTCRAEDRTGESLAGELCPLCQ